MNAPHPLQALSQPHLPPPPLDDDDQVNLLEYWDIVVDNRWLVGAITALAVAIGCAYAFLAKPVFEANLLIQVEDSATSAKSFLGEAASLFDVKTPATAEIEIIRSRMVIGQAVDNTLLYVKAEPRYLPIFGESLARRSTGLSDPVNGWVTGKETMKATSFEVPMDLEGTTFRLTAGADGHYTLTHPDIDEELKGTVGTTLTHLTPSGLISLHVSAISANPGAEFDLTRHSRLEMIEDLQDKLKLTEKGRQSGVIDATLQDTDRSKLTLILNEIGQQYVRQNVERKAAEAQKTLAFLDVQLPQFKKQLDQSEEAYNRYRNQQGTIALDEEARLIVSRSVDLQSKLLDAQQRRRELISRFTIEHPAVRTLDDQIAAWNQEISNLNSRVRGLPSVQQDAIRLERDVKVSNELYQQLRNNALQLQLVREGKIGNVRLIDPAAAPVEPVRPKRPIAIAISVLVGLIVGIVAALGRSSLRRGIRSAQEIEAGAGLNVYSTIPLSQSQGSLTRKVSSKAPGTHLIATADPTDASVESLRSLRTALQFAMLEARNNRLLITGPTPGVGKSFVSANLAAVIASAGKRVLLIDADLRKGHLNQYFGLARENGLSELICGSLPNDAAIKRNVLPNLDFVPTGIFPPNPAELLMNGSLGAFLDSVASAYDLVVIDSAPILVAADTLSASLHAHTVLMVARAELTQLGELSEAARRLAHAGRTITGVVFNGVDLHRRHYGSYGYRYGTYRYKHYTYERP